MQRIPSLESCPDAMRPHVAKVLAGEYDLPPHLELIEPPKTVLDIGANVGAFTAWARAKWPECCVNAYEPLGDNFNEFLRNHGGDDRVFARQVAVGLGFGSAKLRLGRNNCGEASFYDLGEQTDDAELVTFVDAGSLQSADFIKIDTEGSEDRILKNLSLSSAKVVTFEWHGRDRRERCAEILIASGFERVGTTMSSAERGVEVWVWPPAVQHRSIAILSRGDGLPHIYLALPIYGGMGTGFHQSVLDLVTAPKSYHLSIKHLPGESLVSRARNRLVSTFLKSEATHLLFIDSDIIFTPLDIERAIGHGEPIVAGCYAKKQRQLGWVANLLEPCPDPDERGLVPVKYAGTGFLLIAREVFEKMICCREDLRYDPDNGDSEVGSLWDFFPVGVWRHEASDYRRLLSEDWWFCENARELGYTIHLDTGIILGHVGAATYPLQPVESYADPVGEDPA